MITFNKVLSGSQWDSGVHRGFYCGIKNGHNEYVMESLDRHLTREEITSVEMMIASMVNSILQSKD